MNKRIKARVARREHWNTDAALRRADREADNWLADAKGLRLHRNKNAAPTKAPSKDELRALADAAKRQWDEKH